MKHFTLVILFFSFFAARAQKIESIYVNLYTDSLKKGTYNYINIDGLLADGHYLPLDSTHLIFTASSGHFKGNDLWIDQAFAEEKVKVKVVLRKKPEMFKQFDIYIKKKPDDEKLKTSDELIGEMQKGRKPKKQ